ncbi:hypothetical protein THRCLA_21074 [Thraustotheca clavata]|uniref:Uncharacterized protein n=1 Tax=Thraustotheca clavata TaxID=74557 RepID=A0A1W0A0H8_9STRA|nr:hypothetical protein THRCLA_21074 [Thraustotheca clavata]
MDFTQTLCTLKVIISVHSLLGWTLVFCTDEVREEIEGTGDDGAGGLKSNRDELRGQTDSISIREVSTMELRKGLEMVDHYFAAEDENGYIHIHDRTSLLIVTSDQG